MRSIRTALLFPLLTAAPVLAGPDWIEGGRVGGPDAGSTIGGAQPILAASPIVTTIVGSLDSGNAGAGFNRLLSGPDYEDMYLLKITDPSTFSFHVTSAGFDAQLWLFNVTLAGEAFGLLANNDTPTSTDPFLSRPATDLTGADVRFPGIYAIAISGLGRVPVSNHGPIFSFASPTEVSGPDGPGGLNPHIDWTGVGQTGSYMVTMTGVGRYDVPTPGASLLLGGAGLIGLSRRRGR